MSVIPALPASAETTQAGLASAIASQDTPRVDERQRSILTTIRFLSRFARLLTNQSSKGSFAAHFELAEGLSAMLKRRFVCSLALAPLVSRRAGAQPATKTFRVGLLSNFPAPIIGGRLWEGFIQALHQQGFVEGKNVSFELRNAEGATERLPELAAELVRLNVDVLVVGGSASVPGMRAAKDATRTIPIVMAGIVDPVGQGFIASLGRPGGNITGVTDFYMELEPKRLELLKRAAPGIAKVTHLVAQLQLGGGVRLKAFTDR